MIVIIDYGLGNLASIKNMLKRLSVNAIISCDPDTIRQANKLILPGVGAFDAGMKQLNERGLSTIIKQKAIEGKTPLLGICLGMQLLTQFSEEGNVDGLGLIAAITKKFVFSSDTALKIPHMAWTDILIRDAKHPLFNNIIDVPRYYFVHSYYVSCQSIDNSLAKARHGIEFDCVIGNGNVLGVQFHPEKSHKFGMQTLKNFSALQ